MAEIWDATVQKSIDAARKNFLSPCAWLHLVARHSKKSPKTIEDKREVLVALTGIERVTSQSSSVQLGLTQSFYV